MRTIEELGPLPIELCSEYDGAARWCAQRGLKGIYGDPLPPNMDTQGAIRWINADPEAFEERVNQWRYAIAASGDLNSRAALDKATNKE